MVFSGPLGLVFGMESAWLFWLFSQTLLTFGSGCAWDNCPAWSNDGKVHVHVVSGGGERRVVQIPHTHDDMGWIKTVDDYYTGAKKKLVNVGVQFIFDSVLDELQKDASRRFVFAEVGFLARWLHQHHADSKRLTQFRNFVEKGQIEIVGGGWVQPDEAASHYIDLIDQYTLGHRYLNSTFGACGLPKVAWQIDPFGHSREHTNIVASMGHDAIFFGRMHFNELEERHKNKSVEFVWSGSDDQKTNIFAGGFYSNSYAPPSTFCFDQLCQDDPVIADPTLDGFNLPERVSSFVKMVRERISVLQHSNLLLLMGGDFQYSNANMYFSQMDLLFNEINNQYSTPSCYMTSLRQLEFHVPLKDDDFFPYASSEHQYWTGYYTSKPALKGLIRKASAILQLVRQLRVSANLNSNKSYALEEELERSVALAQHHDAVTGTSKEAVTVDYEKRLLKAISDSEEICEDGLRLLSGANPNTPIHFCQLLNETICTPTNSSVVALTLLNSDSVELTEVIRVPIYYENAKIQDSTGAEVPSQIVKAFRPSTIKSPDVAPYEIQFEVVIPALGFRTYILSKLTNKRRLQKGLIHTNRTTVVIENSHLRLGFDITGLLSNWTIKETNTTYQFSQQLLYYEGMGFVNLTEPRTGAYIFRPNGTKPVAFKGPVTLEYYKGPISQEVRQQISPWISQVIRLKQNETFVEFEFTVGPIPKEEKNPIAKEVITRYTVDGLRSQRTFYTDSNGRQLMKRVVDKSPEFRRNATEPVAGNYYPIASRVLVADARTQLVVLTDRSQGCASLQDGQVEVHRRAFADDGWGVAEALDEPGADGRGLVLRGLHWVAVQGPGAALQHRRRGPRLYLRPVLAVSAAKSAADYLNATKTEFSLLQSAVPAQIRVITLQKLDANTILLRLEHIMQGQDDSPLSVPVQVDLADLLHLAIAGVEEMNLSNSVRLGFVSSRDLTFTPMQIRTFRIHTQ